MWFRWLLIIRWQPLTIISVFLHITQSFFSSESCFRPTAERVTSRTYPHLWNCVKFLSGHVLGLWSDLKGFIGNEQWLRFSFSVRDLQYFLCWRVVLCVVQIRLIGEKVSWLPPRCVWTSSSLHYNYYDVKSAQLEQNKMWMFFNLRWLSSTLMWLDALTCLVRFQKGDIGANRRPSSR